MGARTKHTARVGGRLTGKGPGIAAVPLFRGILLLCLTSLAGCGGVRLGASGYRLTSIQTRAVLSPTLTSGWFHSADENSADLYLTDLPVQTLTSPEALAAATGNLVHIRMIVHPRAGRTPIETTAVSAAIVHVVLADGQIGVYEGGGFFSPSGNSRDRTFGGSIAGGSMSLGAATPGFVDRLGASQLTAGVRAARDDERLAEIRGALAWALSVTPRLPEDEPEQANPAESP